MKAESTVHKSRNPSEKRVPLFDTIISRVCNCKSAEVKEEIFLQPVSLSFRLEPFQNTFPMSKYTGIFISEGLCII